MIGVVQLSPDLSLEFVGPPEDEGRLPAVFYFALSAHDSLQLDPYNQPAAYLASYPVRVFSIDLPFHGPNESALDAMPKWADCFANGEDILTPFIDNLVFAIDRLVEKGLVDRERIGLMGLSRGGLIASLVGARLEKVRAIAGFAPMTSLCCIGEFQRLCENPLIKKHDLFTWLEPLSKKAVRYYIGNHDQKVGTRRCFELIEALTSSAHVAGVRSPPFELIIRPSIGHMGHGTPKDAFESGAHWVGERVGVIH